MDISTHVTNEDWEAFIVPFLLDCPKPAEFQGLTDLEWVEEDVAQYLCKRGLKGKKIQSDQNITFKETIVKRGKQ